MKKTALITGVTGQDGALLAAFLLGKGYTVHGLRLYDAVPDCGRLKDLSSRFSDRFFLHYGDLADSGSLYRLLSALRPDELYNLGAMSQVRVSFDVPESTADINGLGALRLLEAVRNLGLKDKTAFYQASSSEMFGSAPPPQNEDTPFHPCSPYGAAKLYAYWLVRTYRDAYGLRASNGILFNHESAIRGEEFVTRKITMAIARIFSGEQDHLALGNLDSRRDWGHAADYVEGMWLMLQQEKADDYVLATGQDYSVRDFVTEAFAAAGTGLLWQGKGLNETAHCRRTGRLMVRVDEALFRPTEINVLRGDSSKARAALGWRPKISFKDLVHEMVLADMKEAGNDSRQLLAAE